MGQDNPIQRQKVSVPDIVIITGMSGSGRTQALHVFEDMGYYCIDNLPPTLILQLANVVGINSSIGRHLAVTCDLRSQGLFDDMLEVLHSLADHELTYSMVFLDSSDEVIMRRYDENRRRHPVAQQGESLEKAVKRERRQLAVVRKAADVVIDTSTMLDQRVAAYVLDNPTTKKFLKSWFELLDVIMPGYVAEGKSHLSIAVGCTGGQHRSVAIAKATSEHLLQAGYRATLSHRDLALANTQTKG